MGIKLLSAILRGKWLIEQNYAANQLPLIASLLSGASVAVDQKEKTTNPYYTKESEYDERGNHKPLIALHASSGTVKASRWRSFDDAPEGSIALIPVTGPILKYGGECGEPGSIHMIDWTKEAAASRKISKALFVFDTPGGMVDGTPTFADTIKNFGKPTVAFVDDGMMASAGMWLGSSCNEIFCSQKTDTVGSIGVYTTLYDFQERLKMMGVKLHEIYAPQSKEKNLDYKEALGGNYQAIEDHLKFICAEFISVIKTNRAGKLNLSAGDPFKGAMYFAEEAIAIGLIDGIKSFDQVVSDMSNNKHSGSSKPSATSTSTSTNMFDKNFKKVSALKGKAVADISAEELQAANAELILEGITAVQLGPDQSVRIQELENQLTAATKTNTELSQTVTTLEAEIAALGKKPGEKPTSVVKTEEQIGADPETGTKFEQYAHNKKALDELDGL